VQRTIDSARRTVGEPFWQHATRLHLTSPVKRCGKSRLLDVIHATCYRPVITVNISPAALVRLIGDDPPTLLIDEIDTVFGKKASDNHEDLRGILNAGHQRNRPYVRCVGVGASQHVESFPSFATAAPAGIGSLPDTIEDRSIIVRLRRRAPGETVAPFRIKKDVPALNRLGGRLGTWVRSRAGVLADAQPPMPVEEASGFGVSGGELPVEVPRFIRSNVGGREHEPMFTGRTRHQLEEPSAPHEDP
jgi:Protein of unknown function (DUF3631)